MHPKTRELTELTEEERQRFADKYDNFFFDIDGTLSDLTSTPFSGVQDVISSLAAGGKEIFVFTDNCTKTRDDLHKRLVLNFPEIKKENILNPGWVLLQHLKKDGINGKIYVMSEKAGLAQELMNAGFEVLFDEPETMTLPKMMNMLLEEGVAAVVVGIDFNFSYLKLTKACNYLSDPSVKFFVSHEDRFYVTTPLLVCAGGLAVPIQGVTGREPVSCGKSSDLGVECIRSLGIDVQRSLFIGDHYLSDILAANKCGMDSLLVLTGVNTTFDETRKHNGPLLTPTYVTQSVADLAGIYCKK